MDGYIADLKAICDLADKYNALVMVDDSHAVGFIGEKGRGTPEYCDVLGRIDIITGTLGKALGGASGGYTSGRKQIIDILRQKSRPNLFSNSIAPAIAAASIKAIEMVQNSPIKLQRLKVNAEYFRKEMTENNFNLLPGDHSNYSGYDLRCCKSCENFRAAHGKRYLCYCLFIPGGSTR